MSELDFLLELLLNHKLQKGTKELIQYRIKEVQVMIVLPKPTVNDSIALSKAEQPKSNTIPIAEMTPQVQQALKDRANLINGAVKDGAGSVKKFRPTSMNAG